MAERVEDLNLPNAVVTRIMRDCLPEGISVAKEARTAVARAASVFVLYLTSSANSAAVQASRKTISANDVFNALEETNFEFFVPPLKEALEGFKKSQQDKKLKMATNAAIKKKDEEAKSSESDVQHREEESEAVGIQEDADDMIEEVEDNK